MSAASRDNPKPPGQLLEQVRERCIGAALDGYEHAGLAGLCEEGRWEAAISAIRRVDLDDLAWWSDT